MSNLNLRFMIQDDRAILVDDFNNVYKVFDTLAFDTELEIEKVQKVIQKEPTLENRLTAMEEALLFITLGGV